MMRDEEELTTEEQRQALLELLQAGIVFIQKASDDQVEYIHDCIEEEYGVSPLLMAATLLANGEEDEESSIFSCEGGDA